MTPPRSPVVQSDALDRLQIASPCKVPWESMKGSPWVRHCDVCKLNVFNLSELTHADALALLERAEGRLCVQLRRRADGTVITADCWSRVRAARRRGLLAAVATTLVMLPALIWVVIQGALNLRAAVLPRVDEVAPHAHMMAGMVTRPRDVLYQPRLPRWSRESGGHHTGGKAPPPRRAPTR